MSFLGQRSADQLNLRLKMTPLELEVYEKAREAYRKAYSARKRLPELEYIIMTNPQIACFYAEDVIKGRWIEAEDIIMCDPHETYCYAIHVIRGKLPDKMHNMMFLHAIEEPNRFCIKEYFEYIK